MYVSNVPSIEWPRGVDVHETRAQRQACLDNDVAPGDDGAEDTEHGAVKIAARKRPTSEGPFKKKLTSSLATGGQLIIDDDEEANRK